MKHFLIIAAILGLFACNTSDPLAKAKSAVEAYGFENVVVKHDMGQFFSCSQDDAWRLGFTATRNGKPIRGAVCGGFFFKNWTVRIEA